MKEKSAKIIAFIITASLMPLPIFEFVNLKVLTIIGSLVLYLYVFNIPSATDFFLWLVLWGTQIFVWGYLQYCLVKLVVEFAVHKKKSIVVALIAIFTVSLLASFLPIYGNTGNSGKPEFANLYKQYEMTFNKSLKDAP